MRKHSALFALPWFLLRAVIYFAAWIGLALQLRRWSVEQDRTGAPALTERFQKWCGPGLILYVFTMSLAAIDWIMSLEPRWYSTIFGMLIIVGQGLTALAFAVLMAQRLTAEKKTEAGERKKEKGERTEPEAAKREALNPDDPIPNIYPPYLEPRAPTLQAQLGTVWQDLGGLMLAFVLLWVYMSFSQYVIIWSGDLPSEISFYLHRRHGGWRWFAWAMIMLHFAVPFVLLLFGGLKRNVRLLAAVALILLAAHFLNMFWLVAPKFHTAGFTVTGLDVVTPLAIGGLWLAGFFGALGQTALIPQRDPRLQTPEAAAQTQQARQELE